MIAAKTFPKEINWRVFFQRYGLLLSLILLCIALSLASSRFMTSSNLLNVLRQSSINGIISMGMMLVILTRGIDLSVGSVLALSTVIGADMLKNEGMPAVQAIGICLLVGAAAGTVNGVLVSWLNIPPFIATLGMMTFARGAAKFYTDGQPISGLDQLGQGFRLLGTAEPLGIPMPIIVAALVFLAGYILLNRIPFGEEFRIGGDTTVRNIILANDIFKHACCSNRHSALVNQHNPSCILTICKQLTDMVSGIKVVGQI